MNGSRKTSGQQLAMPWRKLRVSGLISFDMPFPDVPTRHFNYGFSAQNIESLIPELCNEDHSAGRRGAIGVGYAAATRPLRRRDPAAIIAHQNPGRTSEMMNGNGNAPAARHAKHGLRWPHRSRGDAAGRHLE